MKYILFRKRNVEEDNREDMSLYTMFGYVSRKIEGEEWKTEQEEKKAKKERIEFVAIVESPKDVLKLVRKSPTEKYLLFYGEVEELSIAMPVFMGGKNLAQLDSEWRETA